MQRSLAPAIERLLATQTGTGSTLEQHTVIVGGCINDAFAVKLADGREFFVKTNPNPLPGLFAREAEGLEALTAANALRVPMVIGEAPADAGVPAFLVLEKIVTGQPKQGFYEHFAAAFAQLHRHQGQRFGFTSDNYLGSTPQPNGWHDDWPGFWAQHRLGHMLRLARQQGQATAELNRLGDRLLARLPHLLATDEPPSLLHGDLWGGNYLVDQDGAAVLIDPAVYYGNREADLAMTRLFGGFEASFYRAYEEEWPLAPDASRRQPVYELYHYLNHLVLFGSGYLSACLQLLRRVAV